ncbi:hypothetical protein KEM56_005238 [Ascosphaera pollenicola]|nr:hypothetical protein KEM56_005238 [Ascosphaera pollenicola]
MHFFKVFSLFSIAVTSAVAAAPMEKRYPIPVAAAQPQPAPAVNMPVRRNESSQANDLVQEIENAVPKVKEFLANNKLDLSNLNLGGIGDLINEIKGAINGSFLSNAVTVINGGAELLGGDAPKIGNQLLTSKAVNALGQQSTYDTLLPLLKNAKPLLSKEFITNTVNLINTISAVTNSLGKILGDLGL